MALLALHGLSFGLGLLFSRSRIAAHGEQLLADGGSAFDGRFVPATLAEGGMAIDGMGGFATELAWAGGRLASAQPLELSESWWMAAGLLALLVLGHLTLAWLARRRIQALLRPIVAALRTHDAKGSAELPTSGPSAIRELAQEVAHFNAQRRQNAAEAAAMTAAISHDLQTPITRLRLRADLIADAALRERFAADLDAVTAMLQEQLDYARSEHLREAYVPVDLATLVESVAEGMLDMGHDVTVEGALRQPYLAALRAVERVVQNLVNNAIAFAGAAHIRMYETEWGAVVCVSDNGPGVPEAMRERVFDPFFRLDSSRNPSSGGTGLGLAIARNLARAHGGDIRLLNRPEGGLDAVFMLPASLRRASTP